MGTMGSDAAYNNFRSKEFQFPSKQQFTANQRWKFYEPSCVIAARRTNDPAAVLYQLKGKFFSRLRVLLDSQVRWKEIRRMDLDSPLVSDAAFSVMIDNIHSQAQHLRKRYSTLKRGTR
jgi:hypothetical protein